MNRCAFRAVCASLLLLAGLLPAAAQAPARRLFQLPANAESRTALSGTASGRPKTSEHVGHLPGDTGLTGMSLILKPTAAQDLALTQLIAEQQDPTSANFHKWLTPAQFGARFGVADGDLTVLQSWLTGHGFSVDEVAPSRNRIVFSGTASAVESAFGVSLERYSRSGKTFFENSGDVSLPASLTAVVGGVTGLSSYHLSPPSHPQAINDTLAQTVTSQITGATPFYTASNGTTHYQVPWDFRQIFGVNPLISSGFDGTGIKIGVLGQSTVDTTQLTYFQTKTGQTTKLPTMILVPHTGTAGQLSTDDESESELDLEYSGGSAPGASILFIYTGLGSDRNATDGNNNGVFDSMAYAITYNLAPILSLSYGGCETEDASLANNTLEPLLRQGNSQGQTFVISTGDSGAASCETTASSNAKVAIGGLSVSYPASSVYATGVGGTQLSSNASTYWSSTNNSFAGSAIGYIPEVAWNDTLAAGSNSLSSSGGGVSAIFAKPTWQTGVGVPNDSHRDVPDVAFPAAVSLAPYLECSVEGACTANAGFGSGTGGGGGGLVGGTSVAAPNFAAMLAVIEQANGGGALGNINPSLYALSAGSSGGSIFHDITSGNNIVPCKGGTSGCSSTNANTNGTMGYSAGVGYDLVTGLGSIAANMLQPALKTATISTLLTPTVNLVSSPSSPATSVATTFTATVAGSGGVPTGTVIFLVDGTSAGTATLSSTGTASLSYAGFTTPGTHVVTASYGGDTIYYGGSATLSVTVTGVATTPVIALTASSPTVTVASGGTTTNTITATGSGGFAGTVNYTAAITSSNGASFSGCYSLPSVTLAANAAASSTITIQTTGTGCTTTGRISLGQPALVSTRSSGNSGWPRGGLTMLSAGLLGCCFLRRRIRPAALLLVAASAMAFGLSGCGSSSSPSTTVTTASSPGTYTILVTGKGVPTSGTTVTTTTTFNLVVQ